MLSGYGFTAAFAAEAIDGWTVKYNSAEGTVVLDSEEKYSGENSIRIINNTANIANHFILLSTPVNVVAGEKYYFGAKTKSKNADILQLAVAFGTRSSLTPFQKKYDWMHYEFEYNATQTAPVDFQVIIQGNATVWMDDFFFINARTGENLLKNPTFEKEKKPEPVVELSDASLEEMYYKISESDSFKSADMEKIRGGFKYMPVYRAENIGIDGDVSDWEKYPPLAMPTLSTQYEILVPDELPKDVEAVCKFAYDEDNFYFLMEVEDDEYNFKEGSAFYWQGDSVQLAISGMEETYGTEIGLCYNPETDKASVYAPALNEAQIGKIKCSGSQSGTKTVYELAFPWDIKFGECPEEIMFSALINDNDADVRRYCVEIAPRGISRTPKSNKDFPVLEILADEKDWYAWIEGEKSGITETEYTYEYFIVNNGEEKSFSINNLTTGTTEEITVPAGEGIRRSFVHTFDTAGEYDVLIEIKNGEDAVTKDIKVSVERKLPSVEYTEGVIEKMQKQASEIKKLIDKCTLAGISTDYETANYLIIEKFAKHLAQDVELNDLSKVYYTEESINKIYEETKNTLSAYLSGEKESLKVPRFVTGDITIDGQTVWADTILDGVVEKRPVFNIGYGHFEDAKALLPDFAGLGMNNTQMETGPRYTLQFVGTPMRNWTIQNNGNAKGEINLTQEEKHGGKYAAKLTFSGDVQKNVFTTFSQTVDVEPGKTYELKGYTKMTNASVYISANNYNDRFEVKGTHDWEEFSASYTAPEGVTSTTIRFINDSNSPLLYIDDVTFTETESGENILRNGDFEEIEGPDTAERMTADLQAMLDALKVAEENNVGVCVLLSPHYFLTQVTDKYKIPYAGGGFLKYNIHHPKAREVVEAHIRRTMELIKDFDSVQSICISNEPAFYTNKLPDFYTKYFREYLKEEYNGDISVLNEAYRTNHTSFEEIDMVFVNNPAKTYDYKIFNDIVFSEWHRWMTEIVKEIMPDVPVHAKIMGYSAESHDPNMIWNGTNYEYYADFFDINGCDYWDYFDDDRPELEKNMWYDYMTSIKNAPVANTEDHIIKDGNTNYDPKHADYVARDIYMGAAHGRGFSDIWIWSRPKPGAAKDLTGGMANRPDAAAKMSKAVLDLNRLSYEITALQQEEREIGILYSNASILNDTSVQQAAYTAYEGAMFSGKRVLFVAESQLEKMHTVKMLIVPNTRFVLPETLPEIKKFILNGGTVLILGEESLKKNERNLDNDAELIDFIYKNSKVVAYDGTAEETISPKPDELYDIIRDMISEEKLYYVKIKDAQTDEISDGIEYNIGVYDGKVLVNLVNNKDDRDIKIYVNDKLCEKSLELRDKTELGEVVTTEKYVPLTIQIDVENCFFDTFGHWAEEDISTLKNEGIVSGVSESRFAPDKNISRAEFLALLVRDTGLEQKAYGNEIPDVDKDKWYADVVKTACEIGIIKIGENFRPDAAITREEMCSLLIAFYEYQNKAVTALEELKFTDMDKIGDKESVKKAVSLGLMIGRDDGSFGAEDNATRAEASSVIARYIKE